MIRMASLSKRFGKHQVLQSLNLSVERTERIALVGSNGAGKTTMIRCLLGEYTHEGVVEVGGRAPRQARREVLRRIGFVPQLPPPLKMPVKELLRFSAAVSETQVAPMASLAARLGLDVKRCADQPFFKLSGGQKQKLLIAIALGRSAEVLVMDEPAANLDPEARGVFFELLAERTKDTTMIISSHRLDEVAPLVNRVVELDCGRVVLDDRVADAPLSGILVCHLTLRQSDAAVEKALREWGFQPCDDDGGASGSSGTSWRGEVAGADRLRFLGLLSRYVGLLTRASWVEQQQSAGEKLQAVAS